MGFRFLFIFPIILENIEVLYGTLMVTPSHLFYTTHQTGASPLAL